MPFVKISIPAGEKPDFMGTIGSAVHDAMCSTIGIPKDNRFQVLTEHAPDELLYDRSYLNVDRSNKCIFVEITLKRGRTPAQKKALYAAIAEKLGARLGWRKEDVMVILTENDLIDWSFGNGEAQVADQ